MKRINTKNKCRRIRYWLRDMVSSRIGLESDWVLNHILHCPRCQLRILSISKVNIALSLIKSQPHKLDLLRRANGRAIGVLKHSLREEPKAQKLKMVLPEPKLLERSIKYMRPVVNAAACITMMILMKIGIFSFVDKSQTEGKKFIKQYYANRLGEDPPGDIFTS
jgi:hypothetical protein